jgi:V8-like Glu-specific endopeptidase
MIGQDYPKLATAEIFGYPWDVNNQEKRIYHQFGGKGEIVSFDNDSLLYRIDTMGGQSGSPVVVEFVKGLYFVVGIHAHFRNLEQLNCGVHLKNAKVDVIRSWIEELSPESRYNIINFKEIRELPQYNI